MKTIIIFNFHEAYYALLSGWKAITFSRELRERFRSAARKFPIGVIRPIRG